MGSGGEIVTPSSFFFFTEGLVNSFALYHNVGMSYEDYWHGPFDLIERYNVLLDKHEENKIKDAWLQGYMVYVAIGTALDGKPFPEASKFMGPDEEEINEEREAQKSVALIHQLMGQYDNEGIKN